MRRPLYALLIVMTVSAAQAEDIVVEHVPIYSHKGRFGGWPANHGIWSWGDEYRTNSC